MMELACGVLGYTPQVFWDITPRELNNALAGYRTRQNEEWERVRWAAYYAVTPYAKKGFKPNQIWLPIDAEKDAQFTTHGEVRILEKKELVDVWKRAGFKLSDSELERIYGKK